MKTEILFIHTNTPLINFMVVKEVIDRTGPDTQICRTSPAGPGRIRTYTYKHFTYQVQIINSHKNKVSRHKFGVPRTNK